jgi:hypothetical protein
MKHNVDIGWPVLLTGLVMLALLLPSGGLWLGVGGAGLVGWGTRSVTRRRKVR